MNWNIFSTIGYVSVALWILVPLIWIVVWRKPSGFLSGLALLISIGAFALAKVNSETHVNRIEPDRSAQIAKQEALEKAKLKAAQDRRGSEVAQIRFAEDAKDDFFDRAGMDESDLKYLESFNEGAEPTWKKEKKTRTGGAKDDSIEGQIGGKKAIEGVKPSEEDDTTKVELIVMSDKDMALAHRVDGANLKVTRWLIFIGLFVAFVDYLRRANIYSKASAPFPLPSSWLNAFTPIPPIFTRPEKVNRPARKELQRLIKRGDSFVYLTDDPSKAEAIPTSMKRFVFGRPVDILRLDDEPSDEFIFQTLWYGRSSFVIDSKQRSLTLIQSFLDLLEERKETRATVPQTVHVVWDLSEPAADQTKQAFARLASRTGFSLFILNDVLDLALSPPPSQSTEVDDEEPILQL